MKTGTGSNSAASADLTARAACGSGAQGCRSSGRHPTGVGQRRLAPEPPASRTRQSPKSFSGRVHSPVPPSTFRTPPISLSATLSETFQLPVSRYAVSSVFAVAEVCLMLATTGQRWRQKSKTDMDGPDTGWWSSRRGCRRRHGVIADPLAGYSVGSAGGGNDPEQPGMMRPLPIDLVARRADPKVIRITVGLGCQPMGNLLLGD